MRAPQRCGNCDRLISAGSEVITYCAEHTPGYAEEGPVCDACRARPDADTCVRCGALWWSRVAPPYTEDNSPGVVCGYCWSEI